MNIPKDKEIYFHKIILNLILVSEDFKSILQSEFPNIYADIQSASVNPNCSCVKKVEKELFENKEKSLHLLNNFLSNKTNLEKIQSVLNVDYESLSPKSYSGKMFTIENTEEKFKEFVSLVQKDKGMFRNFSTAINAEGKLHIYFI
jgi:hypothetical protein